MAGLDGALAHLPSEIVLRVIDYLPLPSIAALSRASKNWHHFINEVHQDHVYRLKADHGNNRDFSFLKDYQSFSKYFEDTSSWRQLCKKQTLLEKNWTSYKPTTRECFLDAGTEAIWRFRPDFKNRWFMCTSVRGGIRVIDMDTGERLWQLDDVRPYAHLECDQGWAAWDRQGNAIELWRVIQSENSRGHFELVTVLPHDCETRGFHLVYPTLCVVATDGHAFVYDISEGLPRLQTKLDIETGAVGHLFQEEKAVMYSMGRKGYHFHSKETGELLGILEPKHCTTQIYHIRHPPPHSALYAQTSKEVLSSTPDLGPPTHDRLVCLELGPGPHSRHTSDYWSPEDDEWGAGLLSGKLMVGISRSGRIIVCSDWPQAIRSQVRAAAFSAIIECETDPTSFRLGGWLSFKNGRLMVEVDDQLYILTLPRDGMPFVHQPQPIFATPLSCSTRLNKPASWMGVFDDCIMATYAMYRPNRTSANTAKAIRVMSFAPDIETKKDLDSSYASEGNAQHDFERLETSGSSS